MNEFLEQISNLRYIQIQDIATSAENVSMNRHVIADGIVLIIGILFCFLGLKLVKMWSALECFVLGAIMGCIPMFFLNLLPVAALLIILAVGLLFAVLGVIFPRWGMFIVCFTSGAVLAGFLFTMLGIVGFIIGMFFGLIMAILAAIFKGPITIIMTSFQGAVLCALIPSNLFKYDNILIDLAVFILFTILGVLFQFLMKSKEIKTEEIKKAEEVRVDSSKEVEVEAARNLLDEE